MKVEQIKTDILIPYEKNTKKHDKTQISNVAKSIEQYGFVQPIVIDKDNVVVIGHCRLLAAKQLKLKEVPCVMVEDLTEEQVRKLRIVDNKSNESEWDLDFLAEELSDLDFSDFEFDFDDKKKGEENPYTDKVKIPQYEIQGEPCNIFELTIEDKVIDLITEIDMAKNISEEEREFLKKSAYRHRVFDYRKIAEYYASASKEMQMLMEKSALVIIDYEDAIANGYVKLSERIRKLREENA